MVFDLLKSLGAHLDRDRSDDLSRARARAVAGFTHKERRPVKFTPTAKLALAAAGTAAFIVVPVTVVATRGDGGPQTPRAETLASPSASAQALPAPRKDQFVYVHQIGDYGNRQEYVSWYPLDGKSPSYSQRKGQDGMGGPLPGKPGWTHLWICPMSSRGDEIVKDLASPPDCQAIIDKIQKENPGNEAMYQPDPDAPNAYLGDLPTGTAAMKAWIYENSHGGNPPDVQAFTTVGDLLRMSYAPPAVARAFFEATKQIPGVVVKEGVADLLGRKGVELSQTWHGEHAGYVFDPATFRFLGETSGRDLDAAPFDPAGGETPEAKPWTPSAKDEKEAGKWPVKASAAVVKVGIVDHYGDVPK